MYETVISLVAIVGLILACSSKACMLISHSLNVVFRLPHPGPDDIQGSCWCRRYEGPNKHTFQDYVSHLLS